MMFLSSIFNLQGCLIACVVFLALGVIVKINYNAHGMLALTLCRLLFCRGRRRAGAMTGVKFPVKVADLLGREGPALFTDMLRCGGHLPPEVSVKSVYDLNVQLRDGVKGDKAILQVHYTGDTELPTQFFVKFNLQKLSPMRLLVETTEVCRCEAFFYHHMAAHTSSILPSPKCYFVDYNGLTGEFVLLSEVVRFGEDGVLPMKHRIRDETTIEEQLSFISQGGALNAHTAFSKLPESLKHAPRFHDTHQQLWVMAQLSARFGLHHTLQKTLKGQRLNEAFMTWSPPEALLGKEGELIRDMPEILISLCNDLSMLAFGHNDLTTDNVFFRRDAQGCLKFAAFDWQQSCLNNVGQEWAWNLHFLKPEFLDKYEAELIDSLLQTYAEHGVSVTREAFLNAYVLGTVQMFVFGGGSLQLLMGKLHSRGVFATLMPEDSRCCDSSLDDELRELIVGAEMTRRTFTNCCNIMRRHDFASAWSHWKNTRKGKLPNQAPGKKDN